MQAFDYISVKTVSEAMSRLSNPAVRGQILAGGTDILVQMREGRRKADLLVDIKHIPELTGITYHSQRGLRIGTAASCYAVCHNRDVVAHYPGLIDAVALIGGVQIQSRASLGGNLCNASPAADTIPALIVHRATCTIASTNGFREIPVEQFCTGPGKTILQKGEFLLAINLPTPPVGFGAHYLRFIPRNEMDIAEVGAGASVTLDESKSRIVSARIALGAVAPTPLFVEEAGISLEGKEATPQTIQQAAAIAQAAARPIDDLRGTAVHRRHLCAVLTKRALEKAIQRARD